MSDSPDEEELDGGVSVEYSNVTGTIANHVLGLRPYLLVTVALDEDSDDDDDVTYTVSTGGGPSGHEECAEWVEAAGAVLTELAPKIREAKA